MHKKIFHAFNHLENDHFMKVGHQIVKSIDNRVNYYKAFLNDWASWDDTYYFMNDLNIKYIRSNIYDSVLRDIGLTSILYFDSNMFLKYQLTDDEYTADVQKLAQKIQASSPTLKEIANSRKMDFYMKSDNNGSNFLSVIAPITKSDSKFPANGYLVMTIVFDQKLVDKLSELTGYRLEYHTDISGQEKKNITHISKEIAYSLNYSNRNSVYHDISFYDITGDKLLEIRLEQDRAFNTHMNNVLKDSIIVLVLSGVLTIILMSFIIDRFVLSELRQKVERFKKIELNNDLSVRLSETGSFELKELAVAANRAMDKIENLNKEIVKLSNIDALTQIYNRKFFDEQYIKQYKSSARNNSSIAILMIDIDYFKSYNDAHGHVEGDACLKEVASIIKNSISRPDDIAARYGGEEFIIMLPFTHADGAIHIAETIRKNIADSKKPHGASQVSEYITISIGVAIEVPEDSSSSINLISKADKALYQAKRYGRNRVETF